MSFTTRAHTLVNMITAIMLVCANVNVVLLPILTCQYVHIHIHIHHVHGFVPKLPLTLLTSRTYPSFAADHAHVHKHKHSHSHGRDHVIGAHTKYHNHLYLDDSDENGSTNGNAILHFSSSFQYTSDPVPVCRSPEPSSSSSSTSTSPSMQELNNTMQDFFQKDMYKHSQSLLIGSGNMKCTEKRITTQKMQIQLQRKWKVEEDHFASKRTSAQKVANRTSSRSTFRKDQEHESEKVNIDITVPKLTNDMIHKSKESTCPKILELQVETDFLVFTIYAVATLGVHCVQREIDTDSIHHEQKDEDAYDTIMGTSAHQRLHELVPQVNVPEYQFVLLDEDFEAEGPPPLVWIFNRLTGKGRGNMRRHNLETSAMSDTPHLFHAFLKVYPSIYSQRNIQKPNSMVVFHAHSHVEINISFPAVLLKILPVPKEVITRQGSQALRRSMKRDVIPGIRKFRRDFIQYAKRRRL